MMSQISAGEIRACVREIARRRVARGESRDYTQFTESLELMVTFCVDETSTNYRLRACSGRLSTTYRRYTANTRPTLGRHSTDTWLIYRPTCRPRCPSLRRLTPPIRSAVFLVRDGPLVFLIETDRVSCILFLFISFMQAILINQRPQLKH